MYKKYIFFYVLLIAIAMSSATVSATDICTRKSVLKRTEEVCPCTVARSVFDDGLRGLIIGSQNERGYIKFTGKFFGGLVPLNHSHSVEILDGCGRLIKNVTREFDVRDDGSGNSEFFSTLIKDLSLDCGDNAIFFPRSSNCTCARSSKREPPNPKFRIDKYEADIYHL
jgi:hypothetical protein